MADGHPIVLGSDPKAMMAEIFGKLPGEDKIVEPVRQVLSTTPVT